MTRFVAVAGEHGPELVDLQYNAPTSGDTRRTTPTVIAGTWVSMAACKSAAQAMNDKHEWVADQARADAQSFA